ncbi:methyltransferase domain-containing protein [Bacteroidetes/Chlorobi group bacterium Naka2016]|jgi:predicted SAM-dependent methyltransferase|nr:MAG: methyltransferase domain-containing protein [Bacteroidetes/Chlorobi group bacterium Naka2016]
MIRRILFLFNSLLLFFKKNRKKKFKNFETIKINVGSGLNVVPGWINIDGNINLLFKKFPKFFLKIIYKTTGVKKWFSEDYFIKTLKENYFIHHNIRYGLPLPDESVDYIYTSHFLEHIYKDEAEFVIKEFYRILKKGGKVRVVVPDLDYVIDLLNKGKKEEGLSYFFPESRADEFSRHRYLYDFEMIKNLLKRAGFNSIVKRNFREGDFPDVHLLDNRPKDSLHCEAVK